jgi:hypothetical protein
MDDKFFLAGDSPLETIDVNRIVKIGVDILKCNFLVLLAHSYLPSAMSPFVGHR